MNQIRHRELSDLRIETAHFNKGYRGFRWICRGIGREAGTESAYTVHSEGGHGASLEPLF